MLLRRGLRACARPVRRALRRSLSADARERLGFDVVVVGGGPAGLASAIRLKQRCLEKDKNLSVCVLEKAAALGDHILSGNVFEPRGLTELFPNWREMDDVPIDTPVTEDSFLFLSEGGGAIKLPNAVLPRELHNDGNYVVSLSQLVRWLGAQAEELGVEIYPGFAASEVLYNEDRTSVVGVATRDMGIDKSGERKATFERGMELHARQVVFAEGCRGSCSEDVMETFALRAGKDEQTYGLGIKEVWEVPSDKIRPGFVQHTLGYPLQRGPLDDTFGGSFLYHMKPNLVVMGIVVGLDYKNPFLNPYQEFQRWKLHPEIKKHIEGGSCISYGARTLNEGGLHALPKLTFQGGVLVGCSAGTLNSVKIKGSHLAIKSGMLCADSIFDLLTENFAETVGDTEDLEPTEPRMEALSYQKSLEESWIHEELYRVRNCHAAFKYGLAPGLTYAAFSTFVTGGREPWTLRNSKKDCDKTEPASMHKPIEYPKPDGVITFDLLTNLQRSGTNHDHDQPSHLVVKPALAAVEDGKNPEGSLQKYGGPETRFCPAAVYEYNEKDELVINAQNCVHCKTCSIKTPKEAIQWCVPEGGGGPAYQVM